MMDRKRLVDLGTKLRNSIGISHADATESVPGYNRIWDEIVFGAIWSRPGLSLEERMLATLSAVISCHHWQQFESYVKAALKMRMAPDLIQECTIHCGMYSGFPASQTALKLLTELLIKNNVPVPTMQIPERPLEELQAIGTDTVANLHAEQAKDGYASPEANFPGKLYGTAIQFLYGEVWNRPGISRRERMLCSIASFTALDAEKQQRKFFRSAVNVGFTTDEIAEIIIQTAPYSGFHRALNALAIADEVLPN